MLRDALDAALADYLTGEGVPDSPEGFGKAVIAQALDAAKQAAGDQDLDLVEIEAQITVSLSEPRPLARCQCYRITKDL